MPYQAGSVTGNNVSALFINQELQKIQAAMLEQLSRVATAANAMEEALDMNDHEIVNVLTDPDNLKSAASVEYVQSVLGTGVDVGALASQVASTQANLVVVSDMVSLLNGQVQTNVADISALQTTVATLTVTQAMFDQLSGSVTALTQTVGVIQNIATTNQADITALETNLTSLSGSLTALTQTVAVIQNLAATNEANIQANDADIAQLQTDLAAAAANITSLSTSITALTAVVADNQGNIAQLANRPIGFSFQDSLPDNTEVAKYVITKNYILRSTGGATATGVNRGNTSIPATTGNADLEILQNGTVIGTILFGPNDTAATFDIPADVTFGAGTQLIIRTGTQLELESPSITLHLEEQL